MSMIDPKGSANGDRLPVDEVIDDAIADVEDGVEFWKTLGKYRQAQRDLPRVSKSQWLKSI